MKNRWSILLIGAALSVVTSCSDNGPSLFTHDKDTLVLFNRVTLASYAPDRAEIELEVRTGSDFSKMASDGTAVFLETSAGTFEDNGARIEVKTVNGHTVATLVLPEPSRFFVTARAHDVEARLVIDVNDDGSIQLNPS